MKMIIQREGEITEEFTGFCSSAKTKQQKQAFNESSGVDFQHSED